MSANAVRAADRTETTLRIAADHPSFDGHFPGRPITPAVVLLAETLAAIEAATSKPPQSWTISNAKFLIPVEPGTQLTLAHEESGSGGRRFEIRSADGLVASGTIAPSSRPSRPSIPAPEGTQGEKEKFSLPLQGEGRGEGPNRGEGSAEWTRASERGSLPLIRFMVWLSLRLGRPATRVLLRAIAAYFLVFGGAARRASRDYLRRCLGRAPSLAEQYALFFAFASTIHDRIYFLKDRFDLFDIELKGTELFDEGGGALLMGAHIGSFEAMRACGRAGNRRVAIAMYEDNARRINEVLAAVDPAATQDIIALGRVDSMLVLRARLEQGAFVGVLADRTLGDEPSILVPFLGQEAPFPTGPMRMAAALRRRVVFMTGLYRGANRYEIHFEPLADFTDLEAATRLERDERIRNAVTDYARRVEHYCRAAPDNWFNFHDFWKRGA